MRVVRILLLFFGAFLITAAALAQLYLPGQVMKTPTDVDSKIHLTGTAESATLPGGPVEVNVYNRSQTVPGLSDDDMVVWGTYSCVVKADPGAPECVSADDPQWTLVQATTDTFATTRDSALGISDPTELPDGVHPVTGVVNKFPFNSEKKTYPYWDSATGQAVDATYAGTEDLDGLETYVYEIDIPTTQVELAEGVEGTYSNTSKIYVEPLTGSVVNQVTDQRRSLADGSVAFNMSGQFTDAQIAKSVDEAKTARGQLLLVTRTAPLIGYVVGALMLAGGLLLMRRAAKRRAPRAQPAPVEDLPFHGAPA